MSATRRHRHGVPFRRYRYEPNPAHQITRGKRSISATPIRNSSLTDAALASENNFSPPKTLKEIQKEEEAVAAREREVKARLRGDTILAQQPQSTVNCWGLFRPLDRVSLADVQKFQENQQFLEQQRCILASIEREQAEKLQKAIGTTLGVVGKQMTSKKNQGAVVDKCGQKTANIAASRDVSSVAGDNQDKRKKQKKSERAQGCSKGSG
ncbi:unnamed protein product [Peronospora belbahrii]|uniref:Uncharacterized protein n=1 Tax=Peronospora belbahrii TaxID=622444 RepID=A0AAU9KXH2_9STRA|nr:unnamed protein product [Peronospora belbahrii]